MYPNTKYSGHNLYPLGAETQEECAAACLREPECHFWTHNPNVGRCWLKKSDLGKGPSSKGCMSPELRLFCWLASAPSEQPPAAAASSPAVFKWMSQNEIQICTTDSGEHFSL